MTVTALRYDTSPLGTADNWVNRTGGLDPFIRAVAHALERAGHSESEAIQIAVGRMYDWAAGQGKVTAKTRAKAAAAVAHWEAQKAAAHATGKRDGFVGESSSAGDLLPVGPSPKVAAAVEARLAAAGQPHAFRGTNLQACTVCGQPATAPIHARKKAKGHGRRHAGPVGHKHVPTGHVAGNPVRARRAHKQSFNDDAATVEGQLHEAMTGLFERQRKATMSRLKGNRGKRMLRASQPTGGGVPGAPAEGAAVTATPGAAAAPPAAAQIFDTGFWADQTAQTVAPIIDIATRLAKTRVDTQLGVQPSSTDAAPGIITARANRLAGQVTETTFNQIQATLAEGVTDGESTQQLADRVQHVFDVARTRAELIARTESIGALNESADTYAKGLPQGTVVSKEWLAHQDTRTRPTHRLADGQRVPVAQPFHVGGILMQHPGDPDAPPSEVCNCRCSTLYHPGPVDRVGIPTIGGVAS
jgi:SPP1 gp7 family putative phage head morphogenesis protein